MNTPLVLELDLAAIEDRITREIRERSVEIVRNIRLAHEAPTAKQFVRRFPLLQYPKPETPFGELG